MDHPWIIRFNKAYKFLILDDISVVNLDNTKTESFAIFFIIFGASLFKRFHLFSRKSKSTCYIHEGKYCMTSKQYTFKNNVSLHCERKLFYNTKKKTVVTCSEDKGNN